MREKNGSLEFRIFQTQSKENWGYCMRSCSSEEETTPDELEANKNQANSSFPNIPKLSLKIIKP